MRPRLLQVCVMILLYSARIGSLCCLISLEGENAIEEEIEDEIDDDEQEEDLINGINRELFYSEMDREGKDSFDGDDSGADDKNSNSSAGVDYTTNKEPADVPA